MLCDYPLPHKPGLAIAPDGRTLRPSALSIPNRHTGHEATSTFAAWLTSNGANWTPIEEWKPFRLEADAEVRRTDTFPNTDSTWTRSYRLRCLLAAFLTKGATLGTLDAEDCLEQES